MDEEAEPPPNPNLVRVSSNGSSVDSMDGYEPSSTNNFDASSTQQPPTTSFATENMPPGWFPIAEDTSEASAEEIKFIEQSGERYATDEKYWKEQFKALENEEYHVLAYDLLQWEVNTFNGSISAPVTDSVLSAPLYSFAGYNFRLKIYPKGLDGPYLAASLECERDESVEDGLYKQILRGISNGETKTPLSEPEERLIQNKIWRIPVQFHILIFNPQEPRVLLHKFASHAFTANSSAYCFKRFSAVPVYDLGRRSAGQRQALLRGDRLGVRVYFQYIRDPTGRLYEKYSDRIDNFTLTGLNAVTYRHCDGTYVPEEDHRASLDESNKSILSAATTLVLLQPFQKFVFTCAAKCHEDTTQSRLCPLINAFASAVHKVLQPSRRNGGDVSIGWILKAIEWHGVTLEDVSDVSRAWELFYDLIDIETKSWPGMESIRDIMGNRIVKVIQFPRGTCTSVQQLLEPEDRTTGLNAIDSCGRPPKVLQILLPREYFDFQEREWKKRWNAIPNTEDLNYHGAKYGLYAVVLHSERSLYSKAFTLIARPHGRTWYQFGPVWPQIIPLTSSQALPATESNSFAVMYVRADIWEHLSCDYIRGEVENFERTVGTVYFPENVYHGHWCPKEKEPFMVEVINCSIFTNYEKPGIYDTIDKPSQAKHTCQILVDVRDSVTSLKQKIVSHFHPSNPSKICYYWAFSRGGSTRYFSGDETGIVENYDTIYDIVRDYPEGFSVWVAAEESVKFVCKTKMLPQIGQSASLEALADAAEYVRNPETSHHEMSIFEKDENTQAPVKKPTELIFTKVFDTRLQKLTGVSIFCSNDNDDALVSRLQQKGFQDKRYNVFEELHGVEDSRKIIEVQSLPPTKFHPRDEAMNFRILIFQPILSVQEQAEIVAKGGIIDVGSFMDFLCTTEYDPCLKFEGSWRRNLGEPKYVGAISRGFKHGFGREICRNGDEYSGTFRMGTHQGKGRMIFQNQNIYEGDWSSGKMHGKGKYIEAKTGNKYTGGFKAGKKCGEGVTEWKVAEEQTPLCRVCFENEQDCAFIPCGHVCVCITCGRQIDSCPACRKKGVKAVKLYFFG